MDILFLDAPYAGTVELYKETLNYLKKKKYNTVGLYTSVQFVNNLQTVKEQLQQHNISVITSNADRTHVRSQLLGCDSYHNSLNLKPAEEQNIDCYLYIGDGKFHPLALVYAQKDQPRGDIKEIVGNDPIQKKLFIVSAEDIKSILRKYKSSLMKFLNAKNIGIIVTIKPGQEQLRPSFVLEKKYPNKRFYYFIDNTVSFDQLENFNFIDVWVNTACPRIGFDDQEKFRRGVINLNDAWQAAEILAKNSVLMKI